MNFLIRLIAVGVRMHSSRINVCMVSFFMQAQLTVKYAFTLVHAIPFMRCFKQDLEFQIAAW